MKLYKNVDIKDLENILTQGILPISETGNDNWESGCRADNSTDVVYLFKALNRGDSFVNYGLVLLEVECEAKENKMTEHDINNGKYTEYICDRVLPSQIKNVYIPKFVDCDIQDNRINYVDYSCKVWTSNGLEKLAGEIKERFEKTCETSTYNMNYLRGENTNRTMIDVNDDWKYLF